MLLAAVCLATAGYDYSLSRRRIAKYGEQVELNQNVKRHSVEVGVVLLTAVCTVLTYLVGTTLLAFYTGMRVMWFLVQLASHKLERDIASIHTSLAGTPTPSTAKGRG